MIAQLFKPSSVKTVCFLSVLVLVIYSFLLNANETLYLNTMGHDVMIFIDGITRYQWGQIANIDFTSGLGALNYLGGALFLNIADNTYQAFLFFNTTVLALTILFTAYVCLTRLQQISSIVLILYLAIIAAAPSSLGDGNKLISHAMFYNRFGWVALTLGMLLLLPAERFKSKDVFISPVLLTAVLLFTLHLKASYSLSLILFCIFCLAINFKTLKITAISVVIMCAIASLIIELMVPGYHLAYLSDLNEIRAVNEGIKISLSKTATNNAFPLVICLLIYLTAKNIAPNKQELTSIHTVLTIAGITLISLFTLANNQQKTDIPSLIVIPIFIISIVSKLDINIEKTKTSSYILFILVLVYSAGLISEKNSAISRFYRETENISNDFTPYPNMNGLYMHEGNTRLVQHLDRYASLTPEQYRNDLPHRGRSQQIYQSEYAYTISQGAYALESAFKKYGAGTAITFDFSNPFSTVLGIRPATGDYTWYHPERNISEKLHIDADNFFADVDYVMVPKYPSAKGSKELLLKIYSEYLIKHFNVVDDTPLWIIYRKSK